jgi:hypothetical protein
MNAKTIEESREIMRSAFFCLFSSFSIADAFWERVGICIGIY